MARRTQHRRVAAFGLRLAIIVFMAAVVPQDARAATERMLTVAPGVELHVVDHGPAGQGPAVVLIPGWGMSGKVWRDQAAALAHDRRVIVVDPRSQGQSTIVPHGLTPEQRARDMKAVLDALLLDSVVLVGWSQGVQDVAAFVNAYGSQRLAGAILVDAPIAAGSAAIRERPTAAAEQLSLINIYMQAPEAYARGMLKAIIRQPLEPERAEQMVEDLLRTPTALGAAMLVADLYGTDRTAAVPKFTCPTLVIASATSPELDAQSLLAARLPKGRLAVVEGAGHAVFMDQPRRFTELVTGFLRSLPTKC